MTGRLQAALKFLRLQPPPGREGEATILDLGPGAGGDLEEAARTGVRTLYVEERGTLPPPHRGVQGDLYDCGVLSKILPADHLLVWAYGSIAASLWVDRGDWLDYLQRHADVIILVPHWSHDGVSRVIAGEAMEGQLRERGFSRKVVPGVTKEPMCPYLYHWSEP